MSYFNDLANAFLESFSEGLDEIKKIASVVERSKVVADDDNHLTVMCSLSSDNLTDEDKSAYVSETLDAWTNLINNELVGDVNVTIKFTFKNGDEVSYEWVNSERGFFEVKVVNATDITPKHVDVPDEVLEPDLDCDVVHDEIPSQTLADQIYGSIVRDDSVDEFIESVGEALINKKYTVDTTEEKIKLVIHLCDVTDASTFSKLVCGEENEIELTYLSDLVASRYGFERVVFNNVSVLSVDSTIEFYFKESKSNKIYS